MSKVASVKNTSLSDPSVPTLPYVLEDGRETKGNPSKFDFDLFNDELNISFPTYRVKRIALPNDGERWKMFCGTQVICIIEGSKLNKKERAFLRSLEGVNFLLGQAKLGISCFSALKAALKKKLSKKPS
jgi:hypothetical protein